MEKMPGLALKMQIIEEMTEVYDSILAANGTLYGLEIELVFSNTFSTIFSMRIHCLHLSNLRIFSLSTEAVIGT